MAWFSPRYSLGLAFILAVACIWAGSSVLIQHIYQDFDFRSPFLLTYLSNSLLVIYLPLWQVWIALGLVKDDADADREDIANSLHDAFSDTISVDDTYDTGDTEEGSEDVLVQKTYAYTHWDVVKVAAVVCPLWFVANCLYNYSLLMTSVSSSTIISNLAGMCL
jgi:solute carrier family 35 protein F5